MSTIHRDRAPVKSLRLFAPDAHEQFVQACQVVLDSVEAALAAQPRGSRRWRQLNATRAGLLRELANAEATNAEASEVVAWRPADRGAPGVVLITRDGFEVHREDLSPADVADLERAPF